MEKLAQKIITLFSDVRMDHHDIDHVAWWVMYLADTRMAARIIYFCERVLEHGK